MRDVRVDNVIVDRIADALTFHNGVTEGATP